MSGKNLTTVALIISIAALILSIVRLYLIFAA